VLDLYAGIWEGQPLAQEDCVVSADEQTSIQARVRCHATTPQPGQARRVEHEYDRGGAIGRCDTTTGIAPFGQLVDQVMAQEPYRSAPRVFWIVDNGSSHRGAASVARLQRRHPNLVLVHLPTHASWLNQIEIYFSIVQRTVRTPNDFPDLAAVERRLLAFEARYNDTAVPFHWRFTRADLEQHLRQLPTNPDPAAPTPEPLPESQPLAA
jgi:hypothetical protein